VLDVNGVGYEVWATNRSLDAWFVSDAEVEVQVATHVREDAITLYAFREPMERQAFLALQTVTGIGPKLALAALEALSVPELARAIDSDDVITLSRISGVGKKTAQRIALELKGKIAAPFVISSPARPVAPSSDALPLALERLGYSKAEIARAQDALAASGVAPDAPVAERLRAALKHLYGGATA
jgi:Holliday junction DNA helicase RuvA